MKRTYAVRNGKLVDLAEEERKKREAAKAEIDRAIERLKKTFALPGSDLPMKRRPRSRFGVAR